MHNSIKLGSSGKTWAALVGVAALYACSSEGDSSLFTSISENATDAVAPGQGKSGGNGSGGSLSPQGSGGKGSGRVAGGASASSGGVSSGMGGVSSGMGGMSPGPSSSGGAGVVGAVSMCQTGSVDRCDGRDQNCKDGTADEHCPEGCKGAGFGNHGYMFCLYNSNRGEARAVCERNGLYLASIESNLENAWVRATARGVGIETAWLGARDTVAEGTWLWIDGRQFWQGNAAGAPVAGRYAAWFSGQPNNEGGAKDCLLMRTDGLWESIECSEPQSGFVCRAD